MSALSIENSVSPVNSTSLNGLSPGGNSTELDQADFIELLVTQVKNQDPSKPLDPSQFMNQLAQFSTVTGVQELKTSFDSLADKLSSDQSLRAASLVGRDVLVPGGEGLLTAGDTVSGQLSLPQSSSQVTLNIYDGNGELVRNISLGAQQHGNVRFNWDGLDDAGNSMPDGIYTLQADALLDGNPQALEVSVETHIDSITVDRDQVGSPSATVLNLATGSSLPLSFVQQIK